MFKNLMLLSVPVGLCTVMATADVTIDQLAPEQSVVILSVKNVQASMDRLKESKLWDLWEAPQIVNLRKQYIEPMTEEIEELLKELGVEMDTLTLPQGGVGLSIFALTPQEFGDATSGFMLMVDYGENADKTAELIEAAITRGEEDDVFEYEIEEVGEHSVYTFIMIQDDEDDADEFDDDWMGGMGMGMGMPDLGLPEKIHYVQNGSVFMLCTDLETLTDALEDDKAGGGPSLVDREDYQVVNSQLGEADATVVVLLRDLPQMIAGDNPMAGMAMGMIKPFIGDIHAVGASTRINSDKAMIESAYAIYMPDGKVGLSAMFDTQTPYGDLPPFVGQNTIGYSRFNFEFDKVPDFVKQVMGMAAQMGAVDPEAMQEVDEMVRLVTSMLGNEVHTVTTLDRPIDADSQTMIFAVKCTKPQELENFLAEMGPQIGFEPRDFLGQRIFTLPADAIGIPGAFDISIGISNGFILAGSAAGVEQAMRAGGEAELPTLDSDEQYSHAVAVLPQDPVVAAGYSNTIDALEAMIKSARFSVQTQVAEMREFDPEMADEFEAEALEGLEAIEAIDIDLLRKYIGQSVWFVKATDEGFIIRSYMLAPISDE